MKIIFAGTGGAEGIPRIGCKCNHCVKAAMVSRAIMDKSKDDVFPKKKIWTMRKIIRRRSFLLIESNGFNFMIDTPPEIHKFLSSHVIDNIEAIFLSHQHFDHMLGIREFEFWDNPVDIYAERKTLPQVKRFLRFKDGKKNNLFTFHKLKNKKQIIFDSGGLKVIPFRVKHKVPTFGFLFDEGGKKLIHFSDSSFNLNKWHIEQMIVADVIIFHTATFDEKGGDHISINNVLELVKKYELKRIILSHINHRNFPHNELVEKLASYPNITVAYDGMDIKI